MKPFIRSSNFTAISSDHPQRVMIVDDHEIFRHGLRDLINTIEGFQVVAEASSCKDMLTQAEQMRIELVMLDMYLPDGDGIQATYQVKQLGTHPPSVIILSAMMHDDTLIDAILAGADGYLTKDMPAGTIVKSLKGFQHGELALPRKVATDLVHMLVQRYTEKEAELSSYLQNDLTSSSNSPTPTERSNEVVSSSSTYFPMLTPQEAKVLLLLRQGQGNKQIATQLSISPFTVGKHVQNILRKLGVTNRTQAASYTSFEGGTHPK